MIKEFQGDNRWLSNFAKVDVEYDGMTYPSVEHAWVASKSSNEDFRKKCSDSSIHPAEVKKMGDKVKVRSEWHDVKVNIMKELLVSKFNKEPFKTKLIETKNTYIQEGNWWGDTFWGYCLKTSNGRNLLGELIMEVRYEISN